MDNARREGILLKLAADPNLDILFGGNPQQSEQPAPERGGQQAAPAGKWWKAGQQKQLPQMPRQLVQAFTGADGKITPEGMESAKKAWQQAGGSATEAAKLSNTSKTPEATRARELARAKAGETDLGEQAGSHKERPHYMGSTMEEARSISRARDKGRRPDDPIGEMATGTSPVLSTLGGAPATTAATGVKAATGLQKLFGVVGPGAGKEAGKAALKSVAGTATLGAAGGGLGAGGMKMYEGGSGAEVGKAIIEGGLKGGVAGAAVGAMRSPTKAWQAAAPSRAASAAGGAVDAAAYTGAVRAGTDAYAGKDKGKGYVGQALGTARSVVEGAKDTDPLLALGMGVGGAARAPGKALTKARKLKPTDTISSTQKKDFAQLQAAEQRLAGTPKDQVSSAVRSAATNPGKATAAELVTAAHAGEKSRLSKELMRPSPSRFVSGFKGAEGGTFVDKLRAGYSSAKPVVVKEPGATRKATGAIGKAIGMTNTGARYAAPVAAAVGGGMIINKGDVRSNTAKDGTLKPRTSAGNLRPIPRTASDEVTPMATPELREMARSSRNRRTPSNSKGLRVPPPSVKKPSVKTPKVLGPRPPTEVTPDQLPSRRGQ